MEPEVKIDLTEAEMLAIAQTSPALTFQRTGTPNGRCDYPALYRGKVPLRVMLAKRVVPDLLEFAAMLGIKESTVCEKDSIHLVWVNSLGAISAILPNGEKLGLLPAEFDVVEWHPQ